MTESVELQRLCSVLALAKAKGGRLRTDDAAAVLGVDIGDIDSLADALVLIGVPPFGGGDFLDVEVAAGELRVAEDLGLGRSIPLAPADAPVLIAALRFLQAASDPTLAEVCRRAVAAVREAVAPGPRPVVDEQGRGVGWSAEAGVSDEVLRVCRAAMDGGRSLRLRYWNASRGDVQERTVLVRRVVQHTGRWYLDAKSVEGGARRRYRVDRVLDVEIGEVAARRNEAVADPAVEQPHYFEAPPGPGRARLRVRASDLAMWSTALAGVVVAEDAGETVVIELPLPTEVAVLRVALGVGLPFEIVEPAALREVAERWLEALGG